MPHATRTALLFANDMSRILLLNKPYNVLCQFTDNEKRTTLAAYIKEKGLYPAGRLDRDSEGLLLLTDDGKLQHCIAHPEAKLEKTYWVQVEGIPDEAALQQLRDGIKLNDGVTRPAQVEAMEPPDLWPRNPPIRYRASVPDSWIRLTISEGRNRQVRRMTAAAGYPTLRLIRWRIGEWEIGNLTPGQWREVEPGTVRAFSEKCLALKPRRPVQRRGRFSPQRTNRHKPKHQQRK